MCQEVLSFRTSPLTPETINIILSKRIEAKESVEWILDNSFKNYCNNNGIDHEIGIRLASICKNED